MVVSKSVSADELSRMNARVLFSEPKIVALKLRFMFGHGKQILELVFVFVFTLSISTCGYYSKVRCRAKRMIFTAMNEIPIKL